MNTKLDFDDVLILPQHTTISSRKNVKLITNYRFHNKNIYQGIPIIATNMSSVGTIKTAKTLSKLKIMTWLHKFYSIEELKENNLDYNFCVPSVGMDNEQLTKIINELNPKYVNIDVANGYMKDYLDFIYFSKLKFPEIVFFTGTVCTPSGVRHLINCGADIIRVGIGTGGHCETRIKTGIGYPQFSALLECSEVVNNHSGHYLVSDGGCKNPGDIVKAFVAGADFVSIGSMFGAHNENTEEIVKDDNGNKFAKVYGMSSHTAMKKYYGKTNKYRTSEGKTSLIPLKGPIKNTVNDILGGIRSACTYTNSHNINMLKGSPYIKVNSIYNTHFEQHKIGE